MKHVINDELRRAAVEDSKTRHPSNNPLPGTVKPVECPPDCTCRGTQPSLRIVK